MATTIRRMTTRTLTATVALGLAVGVIAFSPDGAAAAPVPPGGDSHQIGCKSLQDQAQDLVDEYADEDTSDTRREQILAELRNIGGDWIAIKCKARYGNILNEMPGDSSGKFTNHAITETAGVYQEPTTSTPTTKVQVYKSSTLTTYR